jgi:hypothetical protein
MVTEEKQSTSVALDTAARIEGATHVEAMMKKILCLIGEVSPSSCQLSFFAIVCDHPSQINESRRSRYK